MTTTPDPFDTPAPGQTGAATPPPPPPPGFPATGYPAAYAAQPGQFGGTGPAPAAPKALATWTIILTAIVTLMTGASSAFLIVDFDSYIATISQQSTTPVIDPSSIIGSLSYPVWIAAFVVLALWMTKIRSNLKALGRDPGGIPAVEWWGWFVPFANYVLPALGMRSVTRGSANVALVLGWWLAFCAYWTAGFSSGIVIFGSIDWNTGLFDEGSLGILRVVTIVSTGALLLSWIFLALLVSKTTKKHLQVQA